MRYISIFLFFLILAHLSAASALRTVRALSHRHEYEIRLASDDIRYGQFDVCHEYRLILLSEKFKLKLFDKSKQIDERDWGSGYGHGFLKSIFWCQSQRGFFILSTCRLYFLSLKDVEEQNQRRFTIDNLCIIDEVQAEQPWEAKKNYLRYITIKEQSNDLFLNRAYHTIEQWDMHTWHLMQTWPKSKLGYRSNDEMRLITSSRDGSYLAMNICFNMETWAIDFRCINSYLSLLKRIEHPSGASFYYKLELFDTNNVWLIIDNNNKLYTLYMNGNLAPEQIAATEVSRVGDQKICGYYHLHMRYFWNNHYLIVGMPHSDGNGKLCFFRLNY